LSEEQLYRLLENVKDPDSLKPCVKFFCLERNDQYIHIKHVTTSEMQPYLGDQQDAFRTVTIIKLVWLASHWMAAQLLMLAKNKMRSAVCITSTSPQADIQKHAYAKTSASQRGQPAVRW